MSVKSSPPWVTNDTSREILVYTHFSYPIVVLVVFLIAFTTHSVLTAPKEVLVTTPTTPRGPGGKPLPRKTSPLLKEKLQQQDLEFSPRRKLVFNWLSLGVVVTFLANAINVIFHALYKRKHNWWCGESVAVSDIFCGPV